MNDLLDPTLAPGLKGLPQGHPPLRRSELAAAGWNVLAGDLPLPIALLKREALEHNVAWMQQQTDAWGLSLAPHGKTTMSPQLFRRQLDAGAWGLTFANATQLAVGVAAGVRRAVIANQVIDDGDLAAIQAQLAAHPGLRVVFLVDSQAQLALIDAWFAARPGSAPFEVMLEIGLDGGRTGCRTQEEALTLARALHASAAVRLAGIECYEGLGATGRTEADQPYAESLMGRAEAVARLCDAQGLFDTDEVLMSAGGSAIFDLVAGRLRPTLGRPVRGLLRSGCYVTHDHGFYRRMVQAVEQRCGCADTLRPALEVWAAVQSRPEARLAILAVGKRDISFDLEMPIPIARAARGSLSAGAVPPTWRVTALNDQHAYLRWDEADAGHAPLVGERVGLGISHPCTTFDKWHWMPVVENDYRVTDAVAMHF
ncbi:alanine racemase [Piscinibacter sp. XHJ-5]|uniref:alanine racemase n=1 Tax=Piscinibacter sp. XHJ-5 TaxID=3037797 RepID=UPI002452E0EF|nr:alanine racemase [Piscinibacter sp. XHJ-5]